MEKELTNVFYTDVEIQNEKSYQFAFASLKNAWNYPDEFIEKVARHFLCASEGNIFLDILDGADDISDAWERYCKFRGAEHEIDYNPFID